MGAVNLIVNADKPVAASFALTSCHLSSFPICNINPPNKKPRFRGVVEQLLDPLLRQRHFFDPQFMVLSAVALLVAVFDHL